MKVEDIEQVAALFKFYNVTTMLELVKAQAYHIEKLQLQLPKKEERIREEVRA